MKNSFNEDVSNPLKYNDVIDKIDAFLSAIDPSQQKIHEFLYGFEEEQLIGIISLLSTCKLPRHHTNYKDLLVEKFTEHFKLAPNDLVVFIQGGIYIKIFFQVESSDGADRRACGLSLETLSSHKQHFFPKDEYKKLVFELFQTVVEDTLSFRKINPIRFKKIFIPVLVNTVEIVVIEHTNLEDPQHIRGFTYFLLRELFDELMLFIAEDILFHFSNADRKAIEFLSHFSINETIDSQGRRHKATPILDESNHAWNITTIRSTMVQHRKAKQVLYDKKNSLISIKKRLETFTLEYKEIIKQIEETRKELSTIDEKINHTRKTIQRLDETVAEEVKFNENGVEKIFGRTALIGKLYKKDDLLVGEKVATRRMLDEHENRLSNKQKEIDLWERKYNENKQALSVLEASSHPMDKQYERIKRALAKTLASR